MPSHRQFNLSGTFIRANRGFLPSKFQKERILMQFYDTLSGKCCALARTHSHIWLRVRFFKKIQDWILKSERIRKKIFRCFTKEINRRFLGSWCLKGTKNPLWKWILQFICHNKKNLRLICLVKKHKISVFEFLDFLKSAKRRVKN